MSLLLLLLLLLAGPSILWFLLLADYNYYPHRYRREEPKWQQEQQHNGGQQEQHYVIRSSTAAAAAGQSNNNNARHYYDVFDGHGGLSAGGTSRLLREYSEPHRSNILDYLFLPGFGASISVLKIEIGGDAQSTVGTEPSHWHSNPTNNRHPSSSSSHSCAQDGYEGWLAQEARKRNPKIQIWSLSWGIPGWIGNGTYYSEENIRYQVSWLECLRSYYGVEPNLIGLWNERPQGSVRYVLDLRRTMDRHGFSNVGITVEATWQRLIENVRTNAAFRSSIRAATKHYSCNRTSSAALESGIKYWSGEDSPTPYQNWTAASCWGRKLNQNYLNLRATSVISWAVVWSALEGLSGPPHPNKEEEANSHEFYGNAFVTASEPWSGHYHVSPTVWIMAHWGQWVQPGWQYLPNGSGSGFLNGGGSYVTLVPPPPPTTTTALSNNSSSSSSSNTNRMFSSSSSSSSPGVFTMIVETLDGSCGSNHPLCNVPPIRNTQHLTFDLQGSLLLAPSAVATVIHRWCSNVTNVFERRPSIPVHANGSFSLTMEPDTICTLSTLAANVTKGSHPAAPPPSKPFPNRCHDNFEAPATTTTMIGGGEEKGGGCYFSDVYGSFARRNQSLTQVATAHPTGWAPLNLDPLTMTGNAHWADFELSASAFINHTSQNHYVRICGGCNNHGYHRILFECTCCLKLKWTGEWAIGPQNNASVGRINGFNDYTWHTLVLKRSNGILMASVDGNELPSASTATSVECADSGMVGLGCGKYHMCSFRNVSVKACVDDSFQQMQDAVTVTTT